MKNLPIKRGETFAIVLSVIVVGVLVGLVVAKLIELKDIGSAIAFFLVFSIPAILLWGFRERLEFPFRRPNLSFRAHPFIEPFKYQDKFDYNRITFLIRVRNDGKSVAEQCRSLLKLTDYSGKIEVTKTLSYPSIDDFFPVPWQVSGKEQESIDIPPTKDYHYGAIKIPLTIMLAKNREDVVGETHLPSVVIMFENPIKEWVVDATGFGDIERGYEFAIRIELIVSSFPKRQFIIRIPFTADTIHDPNKIQFAQDD